MKEEVSEMYYETPLNTAVKVNLESKIRLGSSILKANMIGFCRSAPNVVEVDDNIHIIAPVKNS